MIHADSAPSADSDRTFLCSLDLAPPRLIDAVLAELPPDALPNDPQDRQRWLLYALLQHTAEAQNLDSFAWANEDRVNEYLDLLADGALPADLSELRGWLKYLPANRVQKHARRQCLLELRRHNLCRPETPRPEAIAEQADELARVQRLTTDREWHLLRHAATEGLDAIAESESLPVGTIKSLLSRCRARLRLAS